jgi:hypothetical protein
MSTLVTNQTATRQTVPIRAIMAAGLVGALACAAYVSGVIFVPNLGHRAAAHHPLVLIPDLITTFAFVSLAVTLPGLASVTRLPRWALYTSAAGCAFIAGLAWMFATYVPHVMRLLTDTQANQAVDDNDVYYELLGYPKILFCMVGFIALAIVGWRRRAIPRGASVLLILAGLVSFLAPPWPGGILAGLALAWVARSAHTTAG